MGESKPNSNKYQLSMRTEAQEMNNKRQGNLQNGMSWEKECACNTCGGRKKKLTALRWTKEERGDVSLSKIMPTKDICEILSHNNEYDIFTFWNSV